MSEARKGCKRSPQQTGAPIVTERRYATVAEAVYFGSSHPELPKLESGDLLLWRTTGTGFFTIGNLIRVAGRGEYSHSAMYASIYGVPCAIEVRERYGGRVVTLESQVREAPGQIDVYRPRPGNEGFYHRQTAVREMLRVTGCRYGYAALLRAACSHLAGVRMFVKPCTDDRSESTGAPFCSEATSRAMRAAGLLLVRNLADRFTEPSDQARSDAVEYCCTLVDV